MRKGAQLYTVREYIGNLDGLTESLKKIKAIGYDSIHGWTPPFMSAGEYVALANEIGLTNVSSGGSYERMLEDESAVEAAVEQAKLFGVNLIGIGTLPVELRESEAGYRQFAAGVNKISSKLKQHGMKLMYHSHALEFFSLGKGLKGMDIIVGETDPDGLHFCMDTHWLTAGGVDVVDWIYKVRGRMSVIHFKDYAIVGGAVKIEDVHKQFAEVGEGNIDWQRVVAACKDTGVEYAIVEQDICKGDPFECLKTSYDNMVSFGV